MIPLWFLRVIFSMLICCKFSVSFSLCGFFFFFGFFCCGVKVQLCNWDLFGVLTNLTEILWNLLIGFCLHDFDFAFFVSIFYFTAFEADTCRGFGYYAKPRKLTFLMGIFEFGSFLCFVFVFCFWNSFFFFFLFWVPLSIF